MSRPEFRVFGVDQYGDATDVDHVGTLLQANTEATRLVREGVAPAAVYEELDRHLEVRMRRVFGDAAALGAGGWDVLDPPPPPAPHPQAPPPPSTPWFQYNDGGRAAAGFRGHTRDCVTRSIAIATGLAYSQVYNDLKAGARRERASKGKSSPRTGVHTTRKWFKDYMHSLGFHWVATMGIGTGCRLHLDPSQIPSGRLVVSVSRHYCAVIDGVIQDTYDPSRNGTRCVYGYWTLDPSHPTP